MRLLALLVVVLGIGVGVLYLNYGTVRPCGILRERIRQQEMHDGGPVSRFLATEMPNKVLDGLIAAQYGPMTPGRCIDLLVNGLPSQPRGPASEPGE